MTEQIQWERLLSDTPKSYGAFCIYRDMGANRTLDRTRNVLRKKSGYLRVLLKWSSERNWQERVAAWDDHQDKLRQERHEHKRIEVENNTIADYDFMRKAIEKRTDGFRATNFQGKAHEYETLLALMKHADDYVRRSLGMPDRITESKNEHTGKNGKPIEQRTVNINVPAESAQDAGRILEQLAAMGAIPSEPGEDGHNAEDNGVHDAQAD